MIYRNPRDGAGYDGDGQLVVPADHGMALSHFMPGQKLTWEDRVCSPPGWTHEPLELEPWPDVPADRIRPHSQLCDVHRERT